MKAIHNPLKAEVKSDGVVLYLKDTEKWKQFPTGIEDGYINFSLCCISNIQKNESNSQRLYIISDLNIICVVSQRYWKTKAIHNLSEIDSVI